MPTAICGTRRAGGADIANGTGAALSLYGTAAQINAYLSSGKLKASLSGSSAGSVGVTLNGNTTGIVVGGSAGSSITVSGNTVSASAVSLPTLNLPSTLTVATSNGQITLAAGALGIGEVTRTVVISTTGGNLSATNLGSGVTATGSATNVSTITLTGTEQALSTYLATAGRVVFTGDANTYTLTVKAQAYSAEQLTGQTVKTMALTSVVVPVLGATGSASPTASPSVTLPASFSVLDSNGEIRFANAVSFSQGGETLNLLLSLSDGPVGASPSLSSSLFASGATSHDGTAPGASGVAASYNAAARTMTLSGTAADLSAYLNVAGRLLFNGTASATTYTLTATVQRDVVGVVQSAASAKASLTAAQWVNSSRDGVAVSPLITQLPTSLAITANAASSLVFTGLALDDGDGDANTQGALTLTLSAPSANAVAIANAAASTSSLGNGRQTLVISGTASQLQTLLTSGDIRYTGTATELTLELANAGGSKVLTHLALSAPTQASVSGASAALSLPTSVTTTPGAMVAIAFHAQALVAAGPVTLAFTASGGASLNWDSTPVTGLTISSSAANTVSLQGAPDLINSYLSSGKLKTGGTGSVAVSGAASATITVTQAANSSVATALPTLNLPQTFTVPTANGQITLAANALGSGTDAAQHTRTVVMALSGAGSTPLTAAANSAVGLSAQTSASTITLTGTEAALSSYLATAGNLVFNGSAGSYTFTVTAQTRDGSGSVLASSTLGSGLTAGNAIALQAGNVSVATSIAGTTLRSSTTAVAVSERGFVYSLSATNANPAIGGTGVGRLVVDPASADFEALLAGIAAGRYTVKAYAISGGNTVYSAANTVEQGLIQEFYAGQGGDSVPAAPTNATLFNFLGDPYIANQTALNTYVAGASKPAANAFCRTCTTLGTTIPSGSPAG
jgi:hypothetical protein